MSGLPEFLLARITDDEAAAKTATSGPWDWNAWHAKAGRVTYMVFRESDEQPIADTRGEWWAQGDGDQPQFSANASHIARHDPVRVLAECEAKRRIVEEHGEGRPWSPAQNPGRCRVCTAIAGDGAARFRAPCPTLRLLALPYVDHPDYREAWRP